MKSTTVTAAAMVILSCLLVLCAQGQLVGRSSRCLCSNGHFKPPRGFLKQQYRVRVELPSAFCPQVEIILHMQSWKKCIDPKSPLGQRILKRYSYMKEAAVSTTVTSSQTQTRSPASVHTTSNL